MRPSRIIVGEVRAEECLDLLLALNAGLPGMCTLHANSAREALVKMCTLPLLAGENISARFVVPDRGGAASTSSSTSASTTHGVRRVNEIVGVPGPGRERRHRDRADLRARAAASCAGPAACRRARSATSGSASTSTGSSNGAALMGALVGLGVGVGLLLVWSAFFLPRGPRPRAAATGRTAAAARPGRAGPGLASTGFVVLCAGAAASSSPLRDPGRLAARRRWRSPSALMAALPAGRRGRRRAARRRQREFAEVWPEAVDNLASRRARRACRCPTRWPRSASAGRSRCAAAFDAFALDYQVTGRFGECLDRLKDRLADPVGDRVVEGLRIAREVGGGELGRLLRNLSGYLRDEARTRSEMESRQAWTVNGARLAVAAPWLVLLFMSLPVRGRSAATPRPAGRGRAGRRRRRLRGRLPADDADRPAAHRAADPVVTPARVGRASSGRSPAAGLLLVAAAGAGASAARSSRVRVLPYVRDLPQVGRTPALRAASSSPTSAAAGVFGPLLRSAADAVERVLGGAASVRRRLERAGPRQDRARVPGRAGALGAGRRSRSPRRTACSRALARPAAARCRRWCCALVGFAVGVLARDNHLPRRSTQRERRILAEFPTVAELLALAVAAGESPVAALDRVVRRSGGELSADLGPGARRRPHRRAGRRGLRPAGRAPPGCRWWPGSPQGVAVAVERGTPLADVLHAQAADVREAGRRELIEVAARKEVLMMVPVVFLVLPVTVLFAFWPGVDRPRTSPPPDPTLGKGTTMQHLTLALTRLYARAAPAAAATATNAATCPAGC